MDQIHENVIQCKYCLDVIKSVYPEDVIACGCGRVGISGGDRRKIRLKFQNLLSTETTRITSPAVEGVDYIELTTYLLNEEKAK